MEKSKCCGAKKSIWPPDYKGNIIVCNECGLPFEPQTEEVSDWEKEFFIKCSYWCLPDHIDGSIKEFIKKIVSSTTERVKKEIIEKVEEYTEKTKDLLRYAKQENLINIGEISARLEEDEDIINIITNIK